MGKNPISHTLTIKALKEEIPRTLPSLLKTLGGVRRDAWRQNREKVNQLSQKAGAVARQEWGKTPKGPNEHQSVEEGRGASAL